MQQNNPRWRQYESLMIWVRLPVIFFFSFSVLSEKHKISWYPFSITKIKSPLFEYKSTGEFDVDNSMLRLKEVGGSACFLIEKDQLMSTCGKYDVLLAGMDLYTGVFWVGEESELGGLEECSLLKKHR